MSKKYILYYILTILFPIVVLLNVWLIKPELFGPRYGIYLAVKYHPSQEKVIRLILKCCNRGLKGWWYEEVLEKCDKKIVCKLLDDKDPAIRNGAIAVLAAYPDPIAFDKLVVLTRDPAISKYAIMALGRYGKKALPCLLKFLKSKDPVARTYACWALACNKHQEVIEPAIRLLDDPDEQVRAAAVSSLFYFPEALPLSKIFDMMVNDRSKIVRQKCLVSFRCCDCKKLHEYLFKIFVDPEKPLKLRYACARILCYRLRIEGIGLFGMVTVKKECWNKPELFQRILKFIIAVQDKKPDWAKELKSQIAEKISVGRRVFADVFRQDYSCSSRFYGEHLSRKLVGHTALDYAIMFKDERMIQKLRKHGAKTAKELLASKKSVEKK